MGVLNLFSRNIKWRFQNPVTIVMTLVQPLIWLVIFSTLFGGGSGYTAFVLPGILVMSILSSTGISGIANYSLRASGVFYRFIAMANNFTLPLFFLSTALVSREEAPAFFRVLIVVNPLSYTIDSLRNTISGAAMDGRLIGMTMGVFTVLSILAVLIAGNAGE